MSNYIVAGNDPTHEINIGWDPQLNTFFLHVMDKTKEEDEEGRDVLWVGCTPNEILDLEVLRAKAEEYTEFTSELWVDLYADANK